MNGTSRSFGLWCLVPLAFGLAGCASYSDHAAQPTAYVYVQTSPSGWTADPSLPPSVKAFSAATDGTLTPLQLPSLPEKEYWAATQGNSVYTIDSDTVHHYEIQADGSFGAPLASINTQDYGGVSCGHPSGSAVIDRTGKYLTVELWSVQGYDGGDAYTPCDTWQTYRVQADGGFQFLGYDETDMGDHLGSGAESLNTSTVSGNGQFAYGLVGIETGGAWLSMMKRDSTGTLRRDPDIGEVDPAGGTYFLSSVAADPSNHLAAVVWKVTHDPSHPPTPQLASYTIDPTTGAIQSTNTYANMPQLQGDSGSTITFSPRGDLVVVANFGQFQLFHFNGAEPLTAGALVTLPNQYVHVAWDSHNHLYVLTQSIVAPPAIAQFSLYVYTVSGSSISSVPGSPWNVPNGYSVTVVPQK